MHSSGVVAPEFVVALSNWIRYPNFYAHCFSNLCVPRRSSSQTLPVLRHRPGADRWPNPGLMNFLFGMGMIATGLVHPREFLGSVGLRYTLEEMRIWLLFFVRKNWNLLSLKSNCVQLFKDIDSRKAPTPEKSTREMPLKRNRKCWKQRLKRLKRGGQKYMSYCRKICLP